MEVEQTEKDNRDRPDNIIQSIQTVHLYRVGDQEIEFRLLCDKSDQRRILAREKIYNLPTDARETDRFEVEMLEQVNGPLDPLKRHECIGLRITGKTREPTSLAEISGLGIDAVDEVMGRIFGSEHIERVRQDQLDWYRALELRRAKDKSKAQSG